MKEKSFSIFVDIVLICFCIMSFFIIGPKVSKRETYKSFTSTLDEKKANVLTLTSISAGASFALSLLPEDAGDSVSKKLADMSGYFLLITIAIYIEEWLMAITGIIAFRFVIPIGCIALLALSFWHMPKPKMIIVKVMIFSLILALVVPFSTWISQQIDAVSDESINSRIEKLNNDSDKIIPEDSNGEIRTSISSLWSKVTGGIKGIIEKFNTLVQNLIDTIAAMIVTSCVIPILVFVFLIWITNMIFGTAIKLPDMDKFKASNYLSWTNKKKQKKEKDVGKLTQRETEKLPETIKAEAPNN